MIRSPIFYLSAMAFVMTGLIPTAINLFNLQLFSDNPAVIYMALSFLVFLIPSALIGKAQFNNVL